jgi:hypothetical protein
MRGIRRHLTGPAPSSWQHLQYAIDVFPAPAPAANKWDTIVISCTGFFASISFIDSRGLGSVVMPLLDQLNVIAVQLGPMLESMDDIEGPRQFLEVRRMADPNPPPLYHSTSPGTSSSTAARSPWANPKRLSYATSPSSERLATETSVSTSGVSP